MVSLHPTFPVDQQLLIHPQVSRLDSWRRCLGLEHVHPVRPSCEISEVYRESADRYRHRPYVVLCPQSVRGNREWPAVYWLELAERLRAHGFEAWILCRNGRGFSEDPGYLESLRWGTIAALMETARVVVGNDSAPAHLAGLLEVPTIALLGPTTANIFAHLPSVRGVTAGSEVLPCIGCWFREDRGYVHYPCSSACAALSNLSVDSVEQAVLEHMR